MPVPRFDRRFFSSAAVASRIGDGALGGKAAGLVQAGEILAALPAFPSIAVTIPRMTVLATNAFDAFMTRNQLQDVAHGDGSDDRKAHAFMQADLPVELLGDLRAIVEETQVPLAVRSSSLLEDALAHPFAGVYETKMTPNVGVDAATRFKRLTEAIKFVWASTFFASGRRYRAAIRHADDEEKMAVVIQEVLGRRCGDRFYPQLSGVARSWNYYPVGGSQPEHGVVNLALGLGKTIVDGGVSWTYSPRRPTAPPPFASARDQIRGTQSSFWAVNMGRAEYNPVVEHEYLVQADLAAAEADGALRYVASTYDGRSDRLSPGTGASGPRVVNFAPLLTLRELPLNDVVMALLSACESTVGQAVEIEFAMTVAPGPDPTGRLGLLQVRPMAAAGDKIDLTDAELAAPDRLLTVARAMGNGEVETIYDVVYVRPDRFEAGETRAIAGEIEALNAALGSDGRPYLLIGFGRWGSSDPWLGIPVRWDQISSARVVVEAMLPEMNVEPSQGAHFFHNMTSFGVFYLTVAAAPGAIDWEWLSRQQEVAATAHARHVRLGGPLQVRVDGRTGQAVVRHGGEADESR